MEHFFYNSVLSFNISGIKWFIFDNNYILIYKFYE